MLTFPNMVSACCCCQQYSVPRRLGYLVLVLAVILNDIFVPVNSAAIHRRSIQTSPVETKDYETSRPVEENPRGHRGHGPGHGVDTSHGQRHIQERLRHQHQKEFWLQEALTYLRNYGYFEETALSLSTVEGALRSFQEMAGIQNSGFIDKPTINMMRKPRCGNKDTKKPHSPSKELVRLKRFAQVSKWTDKVTNEDELELKWFIEAYTKDMPKDKTRHVVHQAFRLWSDQVPIPSIRTVRLHFEEAPSVDKADINIRWAEGNHGDEYPFDGAGNLTNILAHTFYPNYRETGSLNGDIHFDDHETWVAEGPSLSTGVNFPYVLVHEIGHSLGLGHSKRPDAIMNPIYKKHAMEDIKLDIDDQCAVNWNYVGPTNTCLFVWLMVELLPRAKESNATSHGLNSGQEGSIMRGRTLETQLNVTLQEMKDVPTCSDDNESRYQSLLQEKLAFSTEQAQRYGPVVCNFLAGLSDLMSFNKMPSPALDNSLHQEGMSNLTRPVIIHSDEGRAVQPSLGSSELNTLKRKRSLETGEFLEVTGGRSPWDRTYFDKQFFADLFALLKMNDQSKKSPFS